jgi:hypothetical protein
MNNEQSKKLFAAIQEIQPIKKDKTNPHFKSRYADINNILEDIKPILHKHGMFIIQPIIEDMIHTHIIDAETGDSIIDTAMQINPSLSPQQKGSEITYYRRYMLQSMLSLEAMDDDANTTVEVQPAKDLPWLNILDKNGNPTDKHKEIEEAIAAGKTFTLQQIKKKYRVSKDVESQLKSKFNIL